MSLRTESIKAYRALYRAAHQAASQCLLYNCTGLQFYVSSRFANSAEQHRRQLLLALGGLHAEEEQLEAGHPSTGSPTRSKRETARLRREMLRQYEGFISEQINNVREDAALLPLAAGNRAPTSILQVLSADVGNASYQQLMEQRFRSFFEHEKKCSARDEAAEEATSERQNRIMQQALLPYGERLLLVHRTAVGEGNPNTALSYLTPWQVTESIVGTRSGVTAHHLQLGRDHIVVEVDETYNKQVIYVCCTREANTNTGSYQWQQDVERVEVSESEEVSRTLFHSEFLVTATRVCDALIHETPLHATRRTVLTGHAVGGAVCLVLGLLLQQRGFEISNVVTFGAPKALLGTLERYAVAVNPVRVVLAGDPLVELPVTGAEGDPFVHIGEILLLSPHSAPAPLPQGHETSDDASTYSADSLSDLLNETEPQSHSPSGALDTDVTTVSSRADDVESGDGDDTDEDTSELQRAVEERYSAQFLVEHYIEHLASPEVELTYAEGDEVWDDGDYAAMRDGAERQSYMSLEERRRRDLQGPL